MMVAVDFNELLNSSVQQYMLNGVLAAYIDARISRSSIPAGVHVYDVRDCSGEDGGYYIGTVEDHVLVNHAGSFITREPLEMLDQEKLSNAIAWKRRCMKTVREAFRLLASPGTAEEKESRLSREIIDADKAFQAIERGDEDEKILQLVSPEAEPAPRIRPYRPFFSSDYARFKWCCDMIIGNFELDENDKDFCIRYRMGEEYKENSDYWDAYMKAGGEA